MKRIIYLQALFAIIITQTFAQTVTTEPRFPTSDAELTMTVNVTGTSLEGYTGDVWIWTWVANEDNSYKGPDAPTNVNPATANEAAALVTRSMTDDNVYTFTMTPADFIGVAASEIPRIGFKLKSMDWGDEIQSDNDRFIDMYEGGFDILVESPLLNQLIVDNSEVINFNVFSTAQATFTLTVDGAQEVQETGISEFNYDYTVTATSGTVELVLTVSDGAATLENEYNLIIRTPVISEPRPAGVINGINYIDSDDSRVYLSLLAPTNTSAYVLGDFTDWAIDPAFQMKRDGEHFWIEVDGLAAGEQYAFQYFVDEGVYVADPFSDIILDPEDASIPDTTYPNLKPFPEAALKEEWYFNRLSVIETGQVPYQWVNNDFVRPANEDLFIYEVLVRDFFENDEVNYDNLIDTLSYIKSLGVNAIELMPITEFNGNDSWGYNNSFMFAPDKYYGAKNKLKEFIDAAHGMEMAVILDVVMNQHDVPATNVLLDFNFSSFNPTDTNPWFNENAPHAVLTFFEDLNHESVYTQNYLDSLNHYWINEYRFDGYRFDLSKGFTQKPTTGFDDWNARDQSRIDILKRMADAIWSHTPDAYVILEHLGDNSEEAELADYGMMLWGNMHFVYKDLAQGRNGGISGAYHGSRGWSEPHLISYMESHDEQRIVYEAANFGRSEGDYNIQTLTTALERAKQTSAMLYLIPGPKMIWQFGELGYDLSINLCLDGTIDDDCRVVQKPVPWNNAEGLDYNNDPERLRLFEFTKELLTLRSSSEVFTTSDVSINESGLLKSIVLRNENFTAAPLNRDEMSVVIISNFDVLERSITITFPHQGDWYHYFANGEVFTATGNADEIVLQPGEVRIYTNLELEPITEELIGYVPPLAPTLLDLSEVQSQGVQLNWGNNSVVADSYVIYRKSGSSDFEEVGTSTETTFIDGSASVGVNYVYAVAAANKAFSGELSNELSITTTSIITSLTLGSINNIKFYPNPTASQVVIEVDKPIDEITLVTLEGREKSLSWSSSSGKILVQFGGLNTGVYLLKVLIRGEDPLLQRIVIE